MRFSILVPIAPSLLGRGVRPIRKSVGYAHGRGRSPLIAADGKTNQKIRTICQIGGRTARMPLDHIFATLEGG